MEWLASLLVKSGIAAFGDSFFKPFLQHLDNQAQVDKEKFQAATGADREVAIAQIQAGMAAYHDRSSLKVTQWLIALALVPPLLHSGSVYLDSTPFWTPFGVHVVGAWAVPKAPPPYDEREWLMISSLLGIQGAAAVGLGALRMLKK